MFIYLNFIQNDFDILLGNNNVENIIPKLTDIQRNENLNTLIRN
jgi:hypothetical protein